MPLTSHRVAAAAVIVGGIAVGAPENDDAHGEGDDVCVGGLGRQP